MKKVLSMALAAALMVGVLAGCGGNNNAGQSGGGSSAGASSSAGA